MEGCWNGVQARRLVSTFVAHHSELTRRNIGTCAVFGGSYILSTRRSGKGWDLAFRPRHCGGFERKIRGGRRRNKGSGARRSGRALSGLNSWGQSRAPAAPIWCLGAQCGRSVRDPICPAAPALANLVAWPGRWGIEAGAPVRPTERRISQPAAAGRRTEDASPRLRVAGVRSPRAAYRADPGASCFP